MALEGAHGTVSIIDKATAPLRAIAAAFKDMGEAAAKANPNLSSTQSAIDGVSAAQNRINRMNEGIKRQTKDIGAQAVGVAALAMSFKSILDPAIKFESSMADVKKLINFDSNQEFVDFGKSLIGLSKAIPMTADGLAQIAAQGGSLGIAKKDLKEFIDISAKMGVAFGVAPKEAGESVGKLVNIFGISLKQVSSLGDAVNHLADNVAAEAPDIINILTRVGGTARVFGLSAEQAGALGSAFLSMGKTPEVAATGINALLLKLGTADTQGAKFKKALAGMGLSTEQLAANIKKDGQGAIVDFLNRVNKIPKDNKLTALSEMFGAEYADDIALLSEGMKNYTDAIGLLGDKSKYAGSMQREFQTRSATTENNLILLGNKVKAVAITFGNVLLPALNSLASILGDIIEPFSNFISDNQTAAKAVGYVAGAILAAKLATLAYTASLWLVSPALSALSAILTVIRAPMLAFNFLMSANPMGLMVIGIAALTGAIALLYANWDSVTAFFASSFEIIKSVVATGVEFIKTYLGWTPIGIILNNWTPISEFFIGFFNGIVNLANAFAAPFISVFTMISEAIKAPFVAFFDWFMSKIEAVMGVVSAIGEFVGGAIGKVGEAAKGASNFFNSEKQGNVFSAVSGAFQGGGQAPTQTPQMAAQAITAGGATNVPVTVAVNIQDGKIKNVESKGATKTNTFLNGGKQF